MEELKEVRIVQADLPPGTTIVMADVHHTYVVTILDEGVPILLFREKEVLTIAWILVRVWLAAQMRRLR